MKLTKSIACLSLVAALAACDGSNNDGYYDSLGNWHQSSTREASTRKGFSGETYKGNNYYTDNSARRGDSAKVTDYDRVQDRDRMAFKKAGYYDYYGHYVTTRDVPYVARSYFPPRGMCRVWFQDLDVDEQPPVESCVGIRNRLPQGAYVIYGG